MKKTIAFRGLFFLLIIGAGVICRRQPLVGAEDPLRISQDGLWWDVQEAAVDDGGRREIIPDRYRLVQLDWSKLGDQLALAPMENSSAALNAPLILSLPLPDGSLGRFQVVEAPVMAPELGAKFAEIRTYRGWGLDDPPAAVHFDRTPAGFHAIIFSGQGTVYIDPYRRGDVQHYLSYYKRDFRPTAEQLNTLELGPLLAAPGIDDLIDRAGSGARSSGSQLRTYRLAVAATGEYTQYHGGSVAQGLAAIVTAVHRVTGIYEREVAVRLVLIANNDQIVYTNSSTDPYTNNNPMAMLSENQTNLNNVIGGANYDVGHVFSTAGGGVAYLGVPCRSTYKAQGVTGRPTPTGDPFYVAMVAHEMGHQFGAHHTFNGNGGYCASNGTPSTAYEPGSGSTIMAYAGICAGQNIQYYSDDYFHAISFDEIVTYTTLGHGNSCAQITSTGNSAPVVNAGSRGFTIPIGTPFELAGSATDADSDPLTYCWEEFDLGPAGHPNTPAGTAPLFRSFSPVSSPTRTFPQISDIVNNTHTLGEILPSITRALNFRLTARDNHVAASAGGVGYDTISFSSTAAAGPFLVTSPNTAVTWTGGGSPAVAWDVANTDQAPVTCSQVDILLSTDGGYTYPTTLLSATANDGSADVGVPNLPTTTARVKVACSDNVFFDISNSNFTILEGEVEADLALDLGAAPDPVLQFGGLTYTATVANHGPAAATGVTVKDTLPAGVSYLSGSAACSETGGVVTCDLGTLAAGHSADAVFAVRVSSESSVSNSASVSSYAADPSPGNNSDSVSVGVIPLPEKVYLPLIVH